MEGTREWEKPYKMHIAPGIYLVVLGYASFYIPPRMAMPRVATTMIALLSFLNKMTAVLSQLPPTGTSIVQLFYETGGFCLFLNMLGHILVFRYPNLAPLLSAVMCNVAASTLVVYLLAS